MHRPTKQRETQTAADATASRAPEAAPLIATTDPDPRTRPLLFLSPSAFLLESADLPPEPGQIVLEWEDDDYRVVHKARLAWLRELDELYRLFWLLDGSDAGDGVLSSLARLPPSSRKHQRYSYSKPQRARKRVAQSSPTARVAWVSRSWSALSKGAAPYGPDRVLQIEPSACDGLSAEQYAQLVSFATDRSSADHPDCATECGSFQRSGAKMGASCTPRADKPIGPGDAAKPG